MHQERQQVAISLVGGAEIEIDERGVEVVALEVPAPAPVESGDEGPARIDGHARGYPCREAPVAIRQLGGPGREGEERTAEQRHRDAAIGRGAVHVAVVPGETFHVEPRRGLGSDSGSVDRVQVAVDGRGHFGRRILGADVLELPLRRVHFLQVEVGARDLRTGLRIVRLHGEHPFQREDRLGVAAEVQGRNAQEVVVVRVARTLRLERCQQLVRGPGVATFDQLLRSVQDLVRKRQSGQHTGQQSHRGDAGQQSTLHSGHPEGSAKSTMRNRRQMLVL